MYIRILTNLTRVCFWRLYELSEKIFFNIGQRQLQLPNAKTKGTKKVDIVT